MLMELSIQNFAVIENINIKFEPGLIIISGDEGTGKSLIVDAIGILLGTRTPAKIIRNGKNSARVEGIFFIKEKKTNLIYSYLKENEIEPESDGILVITRDINHQGRSVSRINGKAVPASLLRNVGRYLVDIHGQLDYISILDVHNQLKLLDSFGNLEDTRNIYSNIIHNLKQLTRELASIVDVKSNGRLELLKYQIDEIERADIRINEEDELLNKLNAIQNSITLKDNYYKIYNNLYSAEHSVTTLLYEVVNIMNNCKSKEITINNNLQKLSECITFFEDLATDFRKFSEQIDSDALQLDIIEERLNLISSLKRKYGNTPDDVLAFLSNASSELSIIEQKNEQKDLLEEKCNTLLIEAAKKAGELSKNRCLESECLSEIINKELGEVGLPMAKFNIAISQEEDRDGLVLDNKSYSYTAEGIDKVEFMISTNPGESLRPLRAIASGGETCRIMLALKSALKKVDPIPTLVFDEIDAGIGGRNADNIGQKLSSLAKDHQVICITHLPQIACYADLHIKLIKNIEGGRASTYYKNIQGRNRIEELAAMLGSKTTDKTMINGAEILINNAHEWKTKVKQTISNKQNISCT